MRSRKFIFITFPILLLVGFYFLGPKPENPVYDPTMPEVPNEPDALEDYIAAKEARHNVKPDNEARIVWADSARSRTPYVVVYLHGFSASQKEGDPVHRRLAEEIGANLYLSRLSDHGIDTTETLLYFTAERLWETAKEALAIGRQLGDKIILMGTSTGGTLAFMLAAEYPDDVYAIINMSPNIAINDGAAFLLDDPWGLQIARLVLGGDYRITDTDPNKGKYWNLKYRLESVVQLELLLETTMTDKTFKRVHQPTLNLYYYKDEENQDPEVKVSAMLRMHEALATPDSMKQAIAFPEAGAHVLGSPLASKDVSGVYKAMRAFVSDKLAIPLQSQ